MSEPTRQLRVQRMSWEAEDVLSLELADPAGHPLPAWEPDAHVDIVLDDGLVRQYSLRITVPEGSSVLEALLDEELDVANDCREEICGSCETKVLDGAVDHRDYVLTENERCSGSTMMGCVSRPLHQRLVLEV